MLNFKSGKGSLIFLFALEGKNNGPVIEDSSSIIHAPPYTSPMSGFLSRIFAQTSNL